MTSTNLNSDQMAEILALKREGKALEAIKRLREMSGLGLAEAKKIYDFLPAGTSAEVNVSVHGAPIDDPAIKVAVERMQVQLTDEQRQELRKAFASGDVTAGMQKLQALGMFDLLSAIGGNMPPTDASAGTVSVKELSQEDGAQVQAMIASGNKIAAIKLVRERTGLGLAEAKDRVDAMPAPPSAAAIRPYEEVGTPIGKYLVIGGVVLAVIAAAAWLLGWL